MFSWWRQNLQLDLCDHQRIRSGCTSAKYDKGPRLSLFEYTYPEVAEGTCDQRRLWSDCTDAPGNGCPHMHSWTFFSCCGLFCLAGRNQGWRLLQLLYLLFLPLPVQRLLVGTMAAGPEWECMGRAMAMAGEAAWCMDPAMVMVGVCMDPDMVMVGAQWEAWCMDQAMVMA